VLLSVFAAAGCANVTGPLDLNTSDPAVDQRKIAKFHSREAASYRVKAQELTERIAVYESLFGSESEWVHGARLLERFYEEAANEQDYLANVHLNIAEGERLFPVSRRGGAYPHNDGHSK
jgi:hypothetical protein